MCDLATTVSLIVLFAFVIGGLVYIERNGSGRDNPLL
jgi:hypothetical protein